MRSRGGTRSVGVFAAQALATCTNQSSRRALVTDCYTICGGHKVVLRTWSFVLKHRDLGHEGGEGERGNPFFLYYHHTSPTSAPCGPEKPTVPPQFQPAAALRPSE